MDVSHLRNAANYLRRRALEELSACYAFGVMLQGEMAIYAWECEERRLTEHNADREALADIMDRVANAKEQLE